MRRAGRSPTRRSASASCQVEFTPHNGHCRLGRVRFRPNVYESLTLIEGSGSTIHLEVLDLQSIGASRELFDECLEQFRTYPVATVVRMHVQLPDDRVTFPLASFRNPDHLLCCLGDRDLAGFHCPGDALRIPPLLDLSTCGGLTDERPIVSGDVRSPEVTYGRDIPRQCVSYGVRLGAHGRAGSPG